MRRRPQPRRILRYTPGIPAEQWGTDMRGYGIKIRGFDANDNSFYKDGLQLQGTNYVSFMNIDTYGAERLELLRGPASVLYGQNGPGGLINYVSKRPTAEPHYELEVGGGTFDRFEGRFDLSGPITEDAALQYRVTGLARESDTQIDYVEADRIFFAPALTWRAKTPPSRCWPTTSATMPGGAPSSCRRPARCSTIPTGKFR